MTLPPAAEVHVRMTSGGASAETWLRQVLADYLGIEPADVPIARAPTGKPFVRGSELQFNLADAAGVMACAVATGFPVGIDVEAAAAIVEPGLIDLATTRRERRAIERLPDPERTPALLRTWVRKEAVVKGIGEGLAIPFTDLTGPTAAHARAARVRISRRRPWWVWDVEAPVGFAAAVAAPHGSIRVVRFD